MKKFLLASSMILIIVFVFDILHYEWGLFIDFSPNKKPSTFVKVENKEILLKKDGKYVPFEIKGVDMGSGVPAHFATDYAIDKKTYLRWFRYIQDMGANTIRVYTMLNDFQNAKICYEKAATINTLLYNAYYSLGQINLIEMELDEAEKYFTKCNKKISIIFYK